MASNLEIHPVINSFIDPNPTNIQLADHWEDTRFMPSNNMQVQKVSHLSAKVNPNFHMPQAISADNMEVDFDPHSVFVQNNLSMNYTRPIHFPSCTLYPPHPDETDKGEINPGCKSVFMACIAKNITEEIMREILGYCGEIQCMKIMENNCCVKFVDMEAADRATNLSNYKIKIENKDNIENTGKIFIYYSSDEIFSRNQESEVRYCEKELTNLSTFVPCSEHRAVIDKLKNAETFKEAVGELIIMLDSGECNVMTFNYFFQMIQFVHNNAERLFNDKKMIDEELKAAETKLNLKMQGISTDLFNFLNLLTFSNSCLNNFNAIQKKEINRVKKHTLSLARIHFTEVFKKLNEKDLGLSKNESSSVNLDNSSGFYKTVTDEDLEKLKEEVKAMKKNLQVAEEKSAAIAKLHEGNEHKRLAVEARHSECEKMLKKLQDSNVKNKCPEEKEECITYMPQKEIHKNQVKTSLEEREQSSCSLEGIISFDMHVISLITIYFEVHPFGVSIDKIHYYVSHILPEIKIEEIRRLMLGLPNMFRMEISEMDKTEKWHFVNHLLNMNQF